MIHINRNFVAFVGLVLLVSVATLASSVPAQSNAQQKVRILLGDTVTGEPGLIRLKHIASVHGDSSERVRQIEQLDLHEISGNDEFTITQSHIRIRLLLMGLDECQFEINGPQSVTVLSRQLDSKAKDSVGVTVVRKKIIMQPEVAILDTKVADAIQRNIAQAFSIRQEDVIVKLNGLLNKRELEQVADREPEKLRIEMLGSGRESLGNRRIRFAVFHGDERQQILNLFASTAIIVQTPVANRAINQGDVFSEANVTFQSNQTSVPPFELLNESLLFGKTASRRISVGSIIAQTAIQAPSATQVGRQKDTIKTRDAVSVTAQVGGVNVRLNNATALQGGGLGDVIRVRNEGTQKVFACRVVAANQVEAIILR